MKKKESKQKKMDVRVDFTPMVDMMMLLITFFMLCTSLAKPQTMELSMPSNDKNLQDQDRTAAKASYTLTMYLTPDNGIYYTTGVPKYDDPASLKKTTWGKDGIRKVLITHVSEDGTQPVQQVMMAKAELDKKKLANPKQYPDSVYTKMLNDIKAGRLASGKISTMTVIIKVTDDASYKNMIDALDEMQICSIGTYVIDKVKPEDLQLLKLAGVKVTDGTQN